MKAEFYNDYYLIFDEIYMKSFMYNQILCIVIRFQDII